MTARSCGITFMAPEAHPGGRNCPRVRNERRQVTERATGTFSHHEILSFSSGYELSGEELERAIADIGQEYLRERAPEQLAGMQSSTVAPTTRTCTLYGERKPNRFRRPCPPFQEGIFRNSEAYRKLAIERYPGLSQEKVYDRDFSRERLKPMFGNRR